MSDTLATEIGNLLVDYAAGQGVRVVELVDHLLLVAARLNNLHCSLASNGESLDFSTGESTLCTVSLDGAKSKLRAMCARLAAICNEQNKDSISPYGGETELDNRAGQEVAPVNPKTS